MRKRMYGTGHAWKSSAMSKIYLNHTQAQEPHGHARRCKPHPLQTPHPIPARAPPLSTETRLNDQIMHSTPACCACKARIATVSNVRATWARIPQPQQHSCYAGCLSQAARVLMSPPRSARACEDCRQAYQLVTAKHSYCWREPTHALTCTQTHEGPDQPGMPMQRPELSIQLR